MNNIENMDKFLETCNLPRLSYEEIGNWSKSIWRWSEGKETEAIIKVFTDKEKPIDDSMGEFYQTFKELTPVLLKLFPEIEEESILPNSFNEVSITLIPKPERHHKKRISQADIPDENRC